MRLCVPFTDETEVAEVAEVLASGYLTQGPKVAEFEKAIAHRVNSRYAYAMSSCTTALHLALVVAGIGAGDDVLVSDFTFPATANVVVQQGARPVLVDVRADTYNLDVEDLERRLTERTRAIVPVHAFGLSAEMDAVMDVAQRHNLLVVEDAACALGALYHNMPCGTIGHIGCFSFHPRKSITTGEGGMIVTNQPDLGQRIQLLRSHGGVRGDVYYRFEAAGFNYRMSDLQAAVGLAQIRKLDWILERRRELAGCLTGLLAPIRGVTPPLEPAGCLHTYQSYVVLLDEAFDRDRVISAMRRRDVETTLGTYALHMQPFFQNAYGYKDGDLPTSGRLFRHSLTLPLYPQMVPADLERVATSLAEALDEAE